LTKALFEIQIKVKLMIIIIIIIIIIVIIIIMICCRGKVAKTEFGIRIMDGT